MSAAHVGGGRRCQARDCCVLGGAARGALRCAALRVARAHSSAKHVFEGALASRASLQPAASQQASVPSRGRRVPPGKLVRTKPTSMSEPPAAERGGAAASAAASAAAASAAASAAAASAAARAEALDLARVATHPYLGGERFACTSCAHCTAHATQPSRPTKRCSSPNPTCHAAVEDLEGSTGGLLEEGGTYRMPVLPLDGLVLAPGDTLPLRLTFRGDRALLQRALAAPPPLTRLLAVVCCQRGIFTPQLMLQRVGCVAEVRSMGSGGVNVLAKGAPALGSARPPTSPCCSAGLPVSRLARLGAMPCWSLAAGRQRVEVHLDALADGGLSSVPVSVLPDLPPLRVPMEARRGLAWHRAEVFRQFDAWRLAAHAKRLFHAVVPQAGDAALLVHAAASAAYPRARWCSHPLQARCRPASLRVGALWSSPSSSCPTCQPTTWFASSCLRPVQVRGACAGGLGSLARAASLRRLADVCTCRAARSGRTAASRVQAAARPGDSVSTGCFAAPELLLVAHHSWRRLTCFPLQVLPCLRHCAGAHLRRGADE